MSVHAYLEVNNGLDWAGHVDFDVKPEIGDKLAYGPTDEEGRRATVVGFEHREQTGGWVFVVKADRDRESQNDVASISFVDSAGEETSRMDLSLAKR